MFKNLVIIVNLWGSLIFASAPQLNDQKKLTAAKMAQEKVKQDQPKPTTPPPLDLSVYVIRNNKRNSYHYKNLIISSSGEIIGSYAVIDNGPSICANHK